MAPAVAWTAPPPAEVDYDPVLEICPMCSGPLVHAWDHDHRGHLVDRCRSCGVRFMNPRYSDAFLAAFYAGYDASGVAGAAAVPWRARADVRRAGKERALDLIAAHCRSLPGSSPSTVLLVGCGDGLEIEVAKAKGWEVHGLEVDPRIAAELGQRHGVAITAGNAEDFAWRPAAYDAIHADQVLEHMKDPLRFLRGAASALRPGGVLFVAVPNIGSLANATKTLLGRLGLKRRRRGAHYNTRHHLFYFAPRDLVRVLRGRLGLEITAVRGSLKPQRKPLTAWLGRWLPWLDSGFLVVARRPLGSDATARRPV